MARDQLRCKRTTCGISLVIVQISTTRWRRKHIAPQARNENACLSQSEGLRKTGSNMLDAELTQFVENVVDELCEPKDVSDSQVLSNSETATSVAQWAHLAVQDVPTPQSVAVQDVPCHHDTQRFASCLVATPSGEPRRTEPTRSHGMTCRRSPEPFCEQNTHSHRYRCAQSAHHSSSREHAWLKFKDLRA